MNVKIKRALRIGTKINLSTPGSIPFIDSSGNISENNSKLFWDETDSRLGIGTNTPDVLLHIQSSGTNTNVTQWDASDNSILARLVETGGGGGWYDLYDATGNSKFRIRTDTGDSFLVNGDFGFGHTAPTAKVHIINSAANNGLILDQNADAGNSTSTGGAMLIENTGNVGAGLVIYSNIGSASEGRLLNVMANNADFDQAVAHFEQTGTTHCLEVVQNSTGSNAQACNVTSTNPNDSAWGVNGVETGKGTVKIAHTGSGDDSTASGLSIDLQGSGTASQGIFVDATDGGTTGDLMKLRNDSDLKVSVGSSGLLYNSGGRRAAITRITSGPYTVLDSDYHVFVITDPGGITINLPVGVANTVYRIVNVGSSSNNITLAPNGAEKLLGAASSTTVADGVSLTIAYDSVVGWF